MTLQDNYVLLLEQKFLSKPGTGDVISTTNGSVTPSHLRAAVLEDSTMFIVDAACNGDTHDVWG
jgi:hypothetical protein